MEFTDNEIHVTSVLADRVGRCYTRRGLARTLGISEDDIIELTDALAVLGCPTSDDEFVYPAFQVHDGRLVDGLADVLGLLSEGNDDPWTWALWLASTPTPRDGAALPHIETLIAGHREAVMTAALHTAAAWRGDPHGL